MYITVTNYKGGVGKTTTAVHLAAYFQRLGPTVLIDGDPNRSATKWAEGGKMPFRIVDREEGCAHCSQPPSTPYSASIIPRLKSFEKAAAARRAGL